MTIAKNLFIRCSEETYKLAHALAKFESRSLNKQIIHMIHNESKQKNINIPEEKKIDSKEQLNKKIKFETDRQLQQFSKIYYNKVKINTNINAL